MCLLYAYQIYIKSNFSAHGTVCESLGLIKLDPNKKILIITSTRMFSFVNKKNDVFIPFSSLLLRDVYLKRNQFLWLIAPCVSTKMRYLKKQKSDLFIY